MPDILIIPDRNRIDESLALAEQYGAAFEYNEFFRPALLQDEHTCRDYINFYKSLPRDRSRDTVHGAFLDITIHSQDPLVREASEKRVRQSLQAATELGVKGVVFHTGTIPGFKSRFYEDLFLRVNEDFWHKVSQEYPEVEIYLENMFDRDTQLMVQLAEKMQDVPRFGICLDYAHVHVFGKDEPVESWTKKLLPYTLHMHINDNDFTEDQHRAVGKGLIDWSLFDKTLRAGSCKPSVLVEVTDLNGQRDSLAFMKANHIYPF